MVTKDAGSMNNLPINLTDTAGPVILIFQFEIRRRRVTISV